MSIYGISILLPVFSDDLFHIYHVIPAAELVAAFVELTILNITEMRMELLAVRSKIFIFNDRIGNAGIEIDDASCLQFLFELSVKNSSVSLSVRVTVKIDRYFAGVIVGCTVIKDSCVCISFDHAVFFKDEIRIARKSL